MNVWKKINSIYDVFSDNSLFSFVLLGCGLCRGSFGWTLSATKNAYILASSTTLAHSIVDIGEILGFIIIALLATKRAPIFQTNVGLSIALLFPVIGPLCTYLGLNLSIWIGFFYFGCFVSGFGYATMFLLWLELYGALTPRNTLITFAVSEIINLLIWFLLRGCTEFISFMVCISCAILSFGFFVSGCRKFSEEKLPSRQPVFESNYWLLILWVGFFSFCYGFADGFSQMGMSTIQSKIGTLLPILLVIIAIMIPNRKFDFHKFWLLSFVLMMVGFAVEPLAGKVVYLPQIFMSAAKSSLNMFVISIVCMQSYQRHTSSALYSGLVFGASIFCMQVGKLISTSLNIQYESTLLFTIVFITLATLSLMFFNEKSFDRQLCIERNTFSDKIRIDSLMEDKKMTRREQSIFEMLVEGKTVTEISDDLFIAPSTVRAHITRVYEKFNVHSRQEFDLLIDRELR